jgi:hypothetical protein
VAHGTVPSVTEPPRASRTFEADSRLAMGRLLAALYLMGGLVGVVSPLLPPVPENPAVIVLLGTIAIALAIASRTVDG